MGNYKRARLYFIWHKFNFTYYDSRMLILHRPVRVCHPRAPAGQKDEFLDQ